jgi:hypothetical protein
MKKLLLLTVIVGGSIAFTSCSKESDFTCVCTTTYSSGTPDVEPNVFRGIDKDAAEKTCTSMNFSNSGTNRTCSLVD